MEQTLKRDTKDLLRRGGWELHRFDPQRSLANYLCSTLFPHFGINCVVDVGAHFGEYGTLLREGGYRGPIVSFEPVEASFRELQRSSAGDANWITYCCALGELNGSMTMNVSLGSDAS